MNNFYNFFSKKLQKSLHKLPNKKKLKTKRNIIITKNLLGKKLLVHNGKKFKTVLINPFKLGSKLGEYVFTRKHKKYKKHKKKKKRK